MNNKSKETISLSGTGNIDVIKFNGCYETFALHIELSCIQINFYPCKYNLINREDVRNFFDTETIALKEIREGYISKYQINAIIEISSIIPDAKLLYEIGSISENEFMEIFISVRSTFHRKFNALKKSYIKRQIQEKGINKNGLSKLRAKMMILQSEN
ncbi:hypothetical protein [Chryseobacterium mulctrae]|uniref:hypothetical protein n=1 Tax=Chryseobacterium mulctrae TaxID=2576777 RepID=UPI0011175A81|nr:hypothetical protein [Chryseobacterium mulctrae]